MERKLVSDFKMYLLKPIQLAFMKNSFDLHQPVLLFTIPVLKTDFVLWIFSFILTYLAPFFVTFSYSKPVQIKNRMNIFERYEILEGKTVKNENKFT